MTDARSIAAELDALYRRGDHAGVIAAAMRAPDAVADNAQATLQLGLAHAMTGAPREAAPVLKRALVLRPDDAGAIGALARVHVLLGETAEAERLIGSLARAASTDPIAAAHLADVYFQAGRAEDAFHLLLDAVKRFAHPALDIRLAEAALRTRRVAIGMDAARRAESRLGATPAVLNVAGAAALVAGDEAWLSSLLGTIDRLPTPQPAAIFDFWAGVLMHDWLAPARRAVDLAAARAPTPARWRLAADLRLATRDIPRAEEAARAALAIAPDDPGALSLLARCKIVGGDIAEAKRLLLEAIASDPDSAVAFDNLTQIDAEAMTADMAAHVERRVADGAYVDDVRAKALLALARRDEALGEHARAFARILEAKAIVAAAARAAGRGYRPEATEAHLQRIKALFSSVIATMARTHPPRFVFIVGMPRSGTSLVDQILASHPDVYGAGERPEMVALMHDFTALARDREAARTLATESARLREHYRAGLDPAAKMAAVVTDKHPLNFWSVGLIKALFPDAGIVNLNRPAADVCLSILRVRFFAEYDFANAVEDVAHYYAAYERMMAHWRALFGDAIYDVSYETFVGDPDQQTRALLNYCGLPWSEACLAPHLTKRAVVTHSAAQVREPIHTRALERRRLYGDALRPIEDALARWRAHPAG